MNSAFIPNNRGRSLSDIAPHPYSQSLTSTTGEAVKKTNSYFESSFPKDEKIPLLSLNETPAISKTTTPRLIPLNSFRTDCLAGATCTLAVGTIGEAMIMAAFGPISPPGTMATMLKVSAGLLVGTSVSGIATQISMQIDRKNDLEPIRSQPTGQTAIR